MPRLNWNSFIDTDSAGVIFSSLELPYENRTELDQSVAAIRLHDDSIIDIEWIDRLKNYRISVYSNGFEKLLIDYR